MIGRSDERGSGISVLVARHDDDDIIKYSYTILILLKQINLIHRQYPKILQLQVKVIWDQRILRKKKRNKKSVIYPTDEQKWVCPIPHKYFGHNSEGVDLC